MLRLLTEDKELKATSVPLSAAARYPQIVRDTVSAHLQGILQHNLAKVAVLYRIAPGVDVWPDEPTKTKLLVAIHQRHDCVHRNGRTKDGATLDVFTTATSAMSWTPSSRSPSTSSNRSDGRAFSVAAPAPIPAQQRSRGQGTAAEPARFAPDEAFEFPGVPTGLARTAGQRPSSMKGA